MQDKYSRYVHEFNGLFYVADYCNGSMHFPLTATERRKGGGEAAARFAYGHTEGAAQAVGAPTYKTRAGAIRRAIKVWGLEG